MRDIAGFPHAVDKDHLTVHLNVEVPDYRGPDFEAWYRKYYHDQAVRFLDALGQHAPQGFTDAIFGEMAHRKASIFRVAVDK